MSETATGVKWKELDEGDGQSDLVYQCGPFKVYVCKKNWWVQEGGKIVTDNYAPDYATAVRDADRWILEREGRLPVPATDGGGWIACADRMPEAEERVEVISLMRHNGHEWLWSASPTHWRPRPVDQHAVAACLFDDRYRPTLEQARAAARHVAGCDECRAKLEAKGGA